MKRILNFAVMLPILTFFVFTSPIFSEQKVAAQNETPTLSNLDDNFTIPNPSRYNSLEDIINALTSLIRPLFIITLGAMILYGGWVRLTSQGDPDKIKSSSQIIVAAIIGFAIAVFAPTIVDFVGRLLGIQTGLIQGGNTNQ